MRRAAYEFKTYSAELDPNKCTEMVLGSWILVGLFVMHFLMYKCIDYIYIF